MNWQEQFENLWTKKLGYKDAALKDKIDFQKFISTEIIEKLINQIPDEGNSWYRFGDGYILVKDLKDQLKDKWL